MSPETVLRAVLSFAVFLLLFEIGLSVPLARAIGTARKTGLLATALLANLVVAPAVILGIAILLRLPADLAMGLAVLGASPCAPVVPVYAELAKADVPDSAGLLALFAVVSVPVSPFLCKIGQWAVGAPGDLRVNVPLILGILFATMLLPLAGGIALLESRPALAGRCRRPIRLTAVVIFSLVIVAIFVRQWGALAGLGARGLLATAACALAALSTGWLLGGGDAGRRRLLAVATGVRNPALALLIATGSFPGTRVVPAVVAGGLLMLLFGGVWAIVSGRIAATAGRWPRG